MSAKPRPLWLEIAYSFALPAVLLGVFAALAAAGHWRSVAIAGLAFILSLPDLVARLRAAMRNEPRPESIFASMLWLSKAQRGVVLLVPFIVLVALAVASRGRVVLIGAVPGLLFIVGALAVAVRREGWSGKKAVRH